MQQDENLALRAMLHDAANQMTVVQAALELLQESGQNARLSQAQWAAESAAELLHQAMDRLHHREPSPAEWILADEELGDVLDLMRATLGSGIHFSAVLNAREDQVLLPRMQLHTTVVNLLINAKRALKGQGQVQLATENVDQKGRKYWVMTLSDNGPGVPEALREAIFAPGGSFSPGGHGLGLSNSRAMARQVGGDLLCLPHTEGACFRLLLPVDEGP